MDLWRTLTRQWKWILALTISCGGIATGAAFLMTPIYEAEAVLMPVSEEQGKGGFAADLAGQLGGLAPLPGIDLGTGGSKDEAIATLKSRAFTGQFIKDENLLPVLFQDQWDEEEGRWDVDDPDEVPTPWLAYETFDKNIRFVAEDTKTGIVTLTIDWTDPDEAARWANLLVERVNTRLRRRATDEAQRSIDYLKQELDKATAVELRQAIYGLIESQLKKIMVANTREEYAFKVIDPAVVPEEEEKPKKVLIISIGVALGMFLGAMMAFIRASFAKEESTTPTVRGGSATASNPMPARKET